MISAGGYQIWTEKAYTDQWWGVSVPLNSEINQGSPGSEAVVELRERREVELVGGLRGGHVQQQPPRLRGVDGVLRQLPGQRRLLQGLVEPAMFVALWVVGVVMVVVDGGGGLAAVAATGGVF